jgi:two-component system NtrC family response regulator
MHRTQPVAIITRNNRLREILKFAARVAASDSPVLLVGETGVGKEIFADYIHRISSRSRKTMVKIGLSAMPPDLMASELFGHEKGAFTSALNSKPGLFEMANQGTVFLDDIDDVPLEIQSKLLRVLESQELIRVGGTESRPIDIRLISASKVLVEDLVKAQLFRSDLLYRINVVKIEIPPLRERKDDIELLAEHFIKRYAPNRRLTLHPKALEDLMNYHWPGNIRELRNVIHRATLFAQKEITLEEIPLEIRSDHPVDLILDVCSACLTEKGMDLNQTLACLEKKLIMEALKKSGGNQTQAALFLNLSLSTFRDRMRKYKEISEDSSENPVTEIRK